MGEEKRVMGQLPSREDIKKQALVLLNGQEAERTWTLVRILNLEEELVKLKDRAIFLKGAGEALKVMAEYCSQGTTPNPKHDENVQKAEKKDGETK